jgi:hypothetical protein
MDLYVFVNAADTASEIFDYGFVCFCKCRQTDGVDKQDPSVENLAKTSAAVPDLWDNSSITITYINYHETRKSYEQKKIAGQNTCFIFSETIVLNIFLALRLKEE